MKNTIKISVLFLIIPLLLSFTAHKFYLSVTEINYSEKDKSIQLLSRIFIDDLEELLNDRYEIDLNLTSSNELENAEDYIERYVKSKILLKIDGKDVSYNFLGKEYDNDVIKCYLEIEDIDINSIETIEIENQLFFETFEEQQNIVHFKFKRKKKSFILIKENDKGLLNF
ncbi:hypothetical protein GTQ40_00900 [Flavobacteriaceae bacterium R38]|nr:hypothetical protein [Flavobacteriaceae bacterium R38]